MKNTRRSKRDGDRDGGRRWQKRIILRYVLVYDSNTEEGCIEIEADFFGEHPIIQLDILQDWIEAATDLYNHTLSEFQRKH